MSKEKPSICFGLPYEGQNEKKSMTRAGARSWVVAGGKAKKGGFPAEGYLKGKPDQSCLGADQQSQGRGGSQEKSSFLKAGNWEKNASDKKGRPDRWNQCTAFVHESGPGRKSRTRTISKEDTMPRKK